MGSQIGIKYMHIKLIINGATIMPKQNTSYAVGTWLLNGALLASYVLTVAIVVEQLSAPILSGYLFF